jgi:hypothetical protein
MTDLPIFFACTAAMTPAAVPPYTTTSWSAARRGAGNSRREKRRRERTRLMITLRVRRKGRDHTDKIEPLPVVK